MKTLQADLNTLRRLVDVEALKSAISEGLSLTPSTDAGGTFAFFDSVIKYLIQWLDHRRDAPQGSMRPAIFISSASLDNEQRLEKFERIRLFRSVVSRDVTDHVYLCAETLNSAYGRRLHANDPDHATSIIDELGYGQRATVVFIPEESAVILCHQGVNGNEVRFRIPSSARMDMTVEQFDRVLWEFHEEHTQTPDGNTVPWVNAKKRIPTYQLEKHIQNWLCFYLRYRVFRNTLIVKESSTPQGRVDIHIQDGALGPTMRSCLLELKVLRSCFPPDGKKKWSEKVNVNHAEDGIDQAVDYRARTKAQNAYLCCYDARRADRELPGIPEACVSNDVRYRRYFMFSSTNAKRAAARNARKNGALLSGQA
jgi:hypothetical protein